MDVALSNALAEANVPVAVVQPMNIRQFSKAQGYRRKRISRMRGLLLSLVSS